MNKVAVGMILGALLVGCGPSNESILRVQSARTLRCHSNNITVSWFRTGWVARVQGCGRFAYYAWIQSQYRNIDDMLRRRAAFDLSCPGVRLRLFEMGSWTSRGVSGCGKRAVYAFLYTPMAIMWTQNSVSGGAPGSTPRPGPPAPPATTPPPPAVPPPSR